MDWLTSYSPTGGLSFYVLYGHKNESSLSLAQANGISPVVAFLFNYGEFFYYWYYPGSKLYPLSSSLNLSSTDWKDEYARFLEVYANEDGRLYVPGSGCTGKVD